MRLDELRPAAGAKKRRKRVGRGPSSGHGKTSTKGHKGHKARSGGGKTAYAVVNLKSLAAFGAGSTVDPAGLVQAGLVKNGERSRVKILGAGDLPHALTVKAHAVSGSARGKIEAAGGRVELLPARVLAS
jgi:large subunit ribosomal protein L15